MKLAELQEAKKVLSFEMPSASEISVAKQKFQNDIKKYRLYHATTESNAKKIHKVGFKPMSYFTVDEPGWDEDVILTVNGSVVANDIYPDPEHMMDSDVFNELFDSKGKTWSYKQVVKQMDKDLLFWVFYEMQKQHEWDSIDGFWVICLEAISSEHIEEE
ncbi:hypothetical protein [Acinetobacter sp.]|uniref:hypothetical protein n=1 Tax=Acinetobacter sp. TaxID=472 RepID=UPI00388FA93F